MELSILLIFDGYLIHRHHLSFQTAIFEIGFNKSGIRTYGPKHDGTTNYTTAPRFLKLA